MQPTRTAGSGHRSRGRCACTQKLRAVPIRSCSRWGLPCRLRCRRRGALLPHHFTLTAIEHDADRGGLFSVALSLGSRPPDVIRHRMSMEPGLSSRAAFRHWTGQPSSRLTSVGMGSARRRVKGLRRFLAARVQPALACSILASRSDTSALSVVSVETSSTPSTRAGRKWRWNAATASRVVPSK